MALADQFLGQIGDDAFGSAIKTRGHTFCEWGNLRNLHRIFSLFLKALSRKRKSGLWPAQLHRERVNS